MPPYFYGKSPDDPWFRVQIAANQRTAEFLAGERINLPAAPVFAGNLKAFGSQRSWAADIDEFLRSLANINVRYLPVALFRSGLLTATGLDPRRVLRRQSGQWVAQSTLRGRTPAQDSPVRSSESPPRT